MKQFEIFSGFNGIKILLDFDYYKYLTTNIFEAETYFENEVLLSANRKL